MPEKWSSLLWLSMGLLAACAVGSPLSTQSNSLWGPIRELGHAEQSQAPALWVEPQGDMTAAWVGSDDAGVHHDARAISGPLLSDVVTLPLLPHHPYAQSLMSASDEHLHLLWLDASDAGELRLYSALLAPGLVVERGPLAVSDRLTLRYSIAPADDGGTTVIWSGGTLAEPALYASTIDGRGFPGDSTLLVRDADWPTLVSTNDGRLHLFWMRASDHTLSYGQIYGSALTQIGSTNSAHILNTGDRLNTLAAAADSTTLYLFWNLTRLSGEDQTWMISRPMDGSRWTSAQRVGVGSTSENHLETGLNTGTVAAVQPGDDWLRWAAPMPGQFDVLPVAGRIDDQLAVVYFQNGAVAGFQQIAPISTLIGPPALRTDRDRYLYLAWAEPTPSGTAALRLATSRG